MEARAQKWIDEDYTPKYKEMLRLYNQAGWNNAVNLDDKELMMTLNKVKVKLAGLQKQAWKDHVTKYAYKNFTNKELRRRFELLSITMSALEDNENEEFANITSSMLSTYGSAKVCPLKNRNCTLESEGLSLEPGITKIISRPKNYSFEELAYIWKGWRDASGKVIRESFLRYIDLINKAAVANKLKDGSELWLIDYTRDTANFRSDLESVWLEVKPLYVKIHAYVRYQLAKSHLGDKINHQEPLPANVLGNMWAQDWKHILSSVIPFPKAPNMQHAVNKALKEQNYDPKKMFNLANKFYTTLGFEDMEMSYDTNCSLKNTKENKKCFIDSPLISKPDWNVVCHASAWTLDDSRNDYRIKMCTKIDKEDLYTIHHELGHIQYFIQYKDLAEEFKSGGNPGFHEAIGDTIALPVETPTHLESLGLLKGFNDSFESDINFLLTKALSQVVFLPFSYLVDQYRWSLFDGTISPQEMNFKWWELREKYQGVVPPVKRNEQDFDAGAKMHIPANVPYIRYFVAAILQFQFYRQLCVDSGQYDPSNNSSFLHKCDFSQGDNSKTAAMKMIRLLKTGQSEPWPIILERFTGKTKLDSTALRQYFAPLEKWIDDFLQKNKIQAGWTSTFKQYFE